MLWRVLVGVAVLLAVGTIVLGVLAPTLVERALLHELHARGLPDARFVVGYVGLSRAAIEDVELDSTGRLRVASLVATYSPLGLVDGEIETLRIEGAQWTVGVDGRELDLGPVETLMEPRVEPRAGEPSRGRLPVRRIELSDAEVIVTTPQQRWHVPVEGALVRADDGFRVVASAATTSLPLDLSIAADADLHVRREDGQWSVRIDAGRVAVASGADERLHGLSSQLAVEGTVSKDHVALRAEQLEGSTSVAVAGLRGQVRRARVRVDADRVEGRWRGRGLAEVGLAAVEHAKSGVRIERMTASLPIAYPFVNGASGGTGSVRVGPLRWRGTTLPAVRGHLVQRGGDVHASLRWPLTAGVSARAKGRVALSGPLAAEVEVVAPPFALDDGDPLAALIDRAVKGTVRGHVAVKGKLGVRDGNVAQSMEVELHRVALTRGSVHLRDVTGDVALDSVVPPVAAVQRVAWKSGRLGKLELGPGHADVGLRRGPTVEVAGMKSDLGKDGKSGRLLVDELTWARGQTALQLAVFAESLDLQAWLDLLGRDEVHGEGTLHGHVEGTLHFDPELQIDLDDGVLVAEPGGLLRLKDERAAESLLAASRTFEDVGELKELVRDRFVEALRSLRYSELRFELVPRKGELAMLVHVAGQGTTGARQEIGGVTIYMEGFEGAVNEMLRLRGGGKERSDGAQ